MPIRKKKKQEKEIEEPTEEEESEESEVEKKQEDLERQEDMKMLLNIDGEFRYNLLTLLAEQNQILRDQIETLKKFGQALNNVGEILDDKLE